MAIWTGATLPLAMKVQFTYDSFGELLTATDALGNTQESQLRTAVEIYNRQPTH